MFRFNLDTNSPVPLYIQVKQAIILDILANKLQDGDHLPPIRNLAKILKLNPNTIAKVYYSLENDGYIEGKRGSGYRVRRRKTGSDKLKLSIIENELKNFLEQAFALGFTKTDIEKIFRRTLYNE